jgi:2-C-methyl-D-erythritol 4-phosphate cytidylyltransferase/2-C-methyl-D-erythritol 2,4-cyclodiphosphate synthase
MKAAGLIMAAGRGSRAGRAQPKQFELIAGRPMLRWSVEAMRACPAIDRIVVVTDAADMARAEAVLAGAQGIEFAPGGVVRTASVRAGLDRLAKGDPPDAVLIHDAARPGLREDMIASLLAALAAADAVAPALPCADALKRVDGQGLVTADVAREELRRVQTPQAFRFAAILIAFAQLPAEASFEDDLAVARAAGLMARLIPGDPRLAKVTYPEDFDAVARTLGAAIPAIGSGFDAHRFGPGDHVTLCGVRIAHGAGLIGHSDADAPWHALTDAILGALGRGDIGDHFPPSDPQWRGADSAVFLRHAADLAREAGAVIANVDITLLCEAPKIKPHREAMRARTAEVLGLPLARVSVKATTTEGLGFLGRGEGLAAQASALLLLPAS